MEKILLALVATTLLLTGCSKGSDEYEVNSENLDPNQVVVFEDNEFERFIRDAINKQEGDITVSDMEYIYSVNINYNDYAVRNIEGLQYAVSLNDFSYRYGEGLESLDPIAYSKTIEYLNISYGKIDGTINEFHTPALERVSFIETNVSDYDFLKDITTITSFTAVRSNVEDITFIKNMDNLESLNLEDNNITDISAVKNKTKLTSLTLQQNNISDVSVLETCTSLEYLVLSYNHVNNIEYLYDLGNLDELRIYEELDQKIVPRTQIEALINDGVSVYYHE